MSGDFRSLADEYGARVYTFALYTLRRREDAEDVTQEVLVRLWQNRESISSGVMTACVMRVTRNLVIDIARRRRARTAVMAEGADAQIAATFVASHHRSDEDAKRGELRGATSCGKCSWSPSTRTSWCWSRRGVGSSASSRAFSAKPTGADGRGTGRRNREANLILPAPDWVASRPRRQ